MPVLFLGLGGDYSLAELGKISEEEVEPRLERMKGVAAVYTQGGRQREIHVYADDEKLKAYGLSLGQLVHALRMQNVRVPGGSIQEGRSDFLIRTSGEFKSVNEINDVVVARFNGSPVYLKDVALVEDAFADRVEELRLGGELVSSLSSRSSQRPIPLKYLTESRRHFPGSRNCSESSSRW